jgi:hypothetical protein
MLAYHEAARIFSWAEEDDKVAMTNPSMISMARF